MKNVCCDSGENNRQGFILLYVEAGARWGGGWRVEAGGRLESFPASLQQQCSGKALLNSGWDAC